MVMAALTGTACVSQGLAQSYPIKPIRVVIGYARAP